jgi:hypothetical protein
LTATYETGTAGTGITNRAYPVQLNAARQAAVYVPWVSGGSYSWTVKDQSTGSSAITSADSIQFKSATGTLGTTLTEPSTGAFVMTLTSPNDNDDTLYDLAGAADASVAANYNLVLSADNTAQDTMVFVKGSNITFTRASNSLTIAAANDDTLYDLAGAASTTAGEYNLVLSADATAQDTMVFKQGSNVTFTRAADLLTIQSKWDANTKTVPGYVAAPGAVANKVWKTDASGNPDWLDDATGDNNTYTITSTGKVITLNDTSTSTAAGTITFVDGNDITVSSAADNTITIASTFTEADTLATVTARGATTSVASTFSGGLTANPATNNTPAVTTNSAIGSIISLGRNALPTNGNRLGKFEFKGYSSGGGSPVVSATITASANIDWVNANNYDSQILFQTTVGVALRTALVSKPGLLNVWGTGSSGGDARLVLNCYNNNHGQTLSAQPHSEGITNTMLLPKGANSTLVSEATETFQSLTTTGTSGLSTLTAGVLNIPNYADGNDNDYLTGLAFDTSDGVLTATVQNQSDVTVDLDGRYLTEIPVATTTILGGIELGSDTALTTTYVTGTAGSTTRSYPVQLNAARQAAVYVPWTDGGEGVTAVTATLPVTSTEGTTPVIAINTMGAAAAATAGLKGAVPPSAAGDQLKFLRADATWVIPPDNNTTYSAGNGINFSGTPATQINADINYISYNGNNNFIDSASNLLGSAIPTQGRLLYRETSNQKIVSMGYVDDLPFSNNSGTVTGTGTSGVVAKWNTAGTGLIDSGLSFPPSTTYANFVLGASGGTTVQFVGNASQVGDFSIKNTTGAIILQPNNVAIADRVASFSTTDIRLNESTIVSGDYLQIVDNTTTPFGDFYVGSKITPSDSLNGFRINSISSGTYIDVRNTGDKITYRDYPNATGTINSKFEMNMSSGNFTATGNIIAFGTVSDKRLKENIKPIDSALDKAMRLQGVTFNWKKSDSILEIGEDIGFIAQDVQKVLPELVRENKSGEFSLRHQGITPILLEAIKELKVEIEELKLNKCNCNK